MDKALVDIDIQKEYTNYLNLSSSQIHAEFAPNIKPRKSSSESYSYDDMIEVAVYYFRHNEGMVKIEENHLNLHAKKGWVAKRS